MSNVETATEFGKIIKLGASQVHIGGHLELLDINGAVRPLRLPTRFWSHFPPLSATLRATTTRPSGVRIATRTRATQVSLRVRCIRLQVDELFAEENSFVACIDGVEFAAVPTPTDAIEAVTLAGEDLGTRQVRDNSLIEFTDLPEGDKTLEIWFPQMMMVDLLDIQGDAPLEPGDRPARPVWLHHGSSISHCGEPPKPTSAWPVVAAQQSGLNVINLGFAGQCLIDPFVADAIAATPADVISLELGVNVVGSRAMDQRTFVPALHGFLDRIRVGHPDTPVVLVSPLLWPGNEDTAGPTLREDLPDGSYRFRTAGTQADIQAGALSLAIARDHLRHVAQIREQAGEASHYLDGRLLYGEQDTSSYQLFDGLHPDQQLYEEMGHRFSQLVFGPAGLLPLHHERPGRHCE